NGYALLKPPQCRPHRNEARHESGPSPEAATTDSGDGDSNSFVAFSESSNRYRREIYESFDTAGPMLSPFHGLIFSSTRTTADRACRRRARRRRPSRVLPGWPGTKVRGREKVRRRVR